MCGFEEQKGLEEFYVFVDTKPSTVNPTNFVRDIFIHIYILFLYYYFFNLTQNTGESDIISAFYT